MSARKIIYILILAATITLIIAALVHFEFYRGEKINLPQEISFSAALQWVIAGGYFLTFVGIFTFGPIIISAAAFAAALGYFDVTIVFLIAVFGEILIDLVLYAIGYFGRIAVAERYGRYFGLTEEKTKKWENLVRKHPGKMLTAIKLAPILPVPGLMLVGSTRMSVRKFTLINFIVALIRAVIFIAIGYYFGQIYDSISRYIKNAEYILIIGLIIVVGIYYAYKKVTEKISEKLEKT